MLALAEKTSTAETTNLTQSAEHVPEHEHHVLLALAQPAVEIRQPVRSVGNIDAQAVAAAHDLVPARSPQSVEHLELETRRVDPALAGEGQDVLDQPFVVGGDGRVVAG